ESPRGGVTRGSAGGGETGWGEGRQVVTSSCLDFDAVVHAIGADRRPAPLDAVDAHDDEKALAFRAQEPGLAHTEAERALNLAYQPLAVPRDPRAEGRCPEPVLVESPVGRIAPHA